MASSEGVQRALAAAAGLSKEEREELVAELIVGLERDREPEPGYDEAWSKEIRRRVDAALAGRSKATPVVAGQLRRRGAARGASPAVRLIFDDEAREELLAAAVRYDDEREGLGSELLDAVDAALAEAARDERVSPGRAGLRLGDPLAASPPLRHPSGRGRTTLH